MRLFLFASCNSFVVKKLRPGEALDFGQAGDRAAKNTTNFVRYPQHRHKRRDLSYQQVIHNAEMYARANLTNILHSNIAQKALGLYKSL